MRDLKVYGPWALVTGASAGIGEEFARALGAAGLNLALTARREDRLLKLAGEIRSRSGVECRCIPLDLAGEGATGELDRATADLDVGLLVNNAGFGAMGKFREHSAERLREMIQLNCTVPMLLTHRFLQRMQGRRRSGIVVVASVAGYQGCPYMACYSATKGFDLLFGEGIAAELSGTGVDVLVVSPGTTATEFSAVAGGTGGGGDSAESVVRESLRALGRKHTVVTGLLHKLQACAGRFFPRRFTAFVAGQILKRHVKN